MDVVQAPSAPYWCITNPKCVTQKEFAISHVVLWYFCHSSGRGVLRLIFTRTQVFFFSFCFLSPCSPSLGACLCFLELALSWHPRYSSIWLICYSWINMCFACIRLRTKVPEYTRCSNKGLCDASCAPLLKNIWTWSSLVAQWKLT